MTRRELFQVGGAAVCAALVPVAASARHRYGHMTVDDAIARGLNGVNCRVFLNGEDVTKRTITELDDEVGYVIALRDESGRIALDGGHGLVKHRLTGNVVFVPHKG
jgi:hypothetical protein